MEHQCGCGCASHSTKPFVYECECGNECKCPQVEFDERPETIPTCCGKPMKQII